MLKFYDKFIIQPQDDEGGGGGATQINATVVGGTIGDDLSWTSIAANEYVAMTETLPLSVANSWEFQTSFKRTGSGSNVPLLLSCTGTTDYQVPQILLSDNVVFVFLSSNGSSYDLYGASIGLSIVSNVVYNIKFGFDGSKYYFDYNYDNSENYTRAWYIETASKVYCNVPFMFMNTGMDLTRNLEGTMYFAKTKFIIDGDVYWEGTK